MKILQNDPSLWRDALPLHDPKGHKYGRGVAVIYGAPKMTGATRLAARACARMGAGLVKVIAPEGTGDIYRSTLSEEIIVENITDFKGFDDPRITSFLIGSGMAPQDVNTALIDSALGQTHIKGVVLDAGAIAVWKGKGGGRIIATPHEGEFAARFGKMEYSTKEERAMIAAEVLGGIIVLKGVPVVIAGGQDMILQDRDVPELSTAGTGDVLAGMITGLVAQNMPLHQAAAAAVWIHAAAAMRFGKGMVASDLPEMIPDILQSL